MTDNQEQHPDLKLTSHFLATNMSPTTDLKSPHEEVVTISEPVEYGSKKPSTFAKLSFVFFFASGIINWYFFTIDSEFYNRYSRSLNFVFKQTSSHDIFDGMKLFVFLGNTIASGVISLHIFTCRCRGTKVTAVIAAYFCIFTSTLRLVGLILMSANANQTMEVEKTGIYYALGVAATYVQFITGLMMVIEMTNIS